MFQLGLRILIVFFLVSLAGPLWAYDRIVSLKPNVTEILFALGLGEKVVGVTTYCHHPPEAKTRPKVGGYSNPNLEAIFNLHPDLVALIPESTSPRIFEAIQRAGIETLVVKTDRLEDLLHGIQTIADRMGVSEKGKKLVADMKDHIKRSVVGIPKKGQKKVLIVVQRRPLIVVGRGNFLDDLVTLAGGKNIAHASSLPYPRFSIDTVITAKPDVIIDLDPTPAGDTWTTLSTLPAVQNHAVFSFTPDFFLPGPRVPQALETLIKTIHAPKQ